MIRTASVPSDVADGGAVDLTSLEVHQSFCTRFCIAWWERDLVRVYLVGATGRERFGANGVSKALS